MWCDRDPAELVDYSAQIHFSEEEDGTDESAESLVEVSEEMAKMLTESCTRCVTNESRKRTRNKYPLPKVPATRTPRLDHFMRTETPQNVKSLDRDLARIQTFVLDAIAPLTAISENLGKFSGEDVEQATTSAIKLIGNASTRISRLRREKVVSSINKSLMPLVQEDEPYANSAPELFGADFAKKSKEFLDQVTALRSSLPKSKPQGGNTYRKPLFRKGQSSERTWAYKRGGAPGQYRRGRGDRQTRQDKN